MESLAGGGRNKIKGKGVIRKEGGKIFEARIKKYARNK